MDNSQEQHQLFLDDGTQAYASTKYTNEQINNLYIITFNNIYLVFIYFKVRLRTILLNNYFPKEISPILAKQLATSQLIDGIKWKRFKKIVLLTGPGINAKAGLRDFRSSQIVTKDQLESFGIKIDYPEDLFNLKYFREKVPYQNLLPYPLQPQDFYKIAHLFFSEIEKAETVLAHKFIKALQDNGQLLLNFTQNIDSLELEAGISQDKLIQAHGHFRTVHCIGCKKEHDKKKMMEAFQTQNIYRCEDEKCNGLIKPDIIFFWEELSNQYQQNWNIIHEADLIIVMGTSLKVAPLNMLPSLTQKIPTVVINSEPIEPILNNSLFLQGEVEDVLSDLVKILGWNIQLPIII